MLRGPLNKADYRPQFSRHQTFPIRYGWLKKVYDAVSESERDDKIKEIFLNEDAIARFGVGKNMVASMRHWANATSIIEESQNSLDIKLTSLGKKLFDDKTGLDPYMEHQATLWLLHWHLSGCSRMTTWFWAFNNFASTMFERSQFEREFIRFGHEAGWPPMAERTIKNDVSCFIRTYATNKDTKMGYDGEIESPLVELGLIKSAGRDNFHFIRGAKPTLGKGVFLYALLDFWDKRTETEASTLSFEAITHEPGSPGRVFLLDEDNVADYLLALDEITKGALHWSETSGLKQVIRASGKNIADKLSYIEEDFSLPKRKDAA